MATRRRRQRSASITTSPDPAVMGPLLREAGFVACETDPVSCRATFDADGTPRGISALYENGWSCRLRLNRSGSYSLTQSIRLVGRRKANA